MAERRAVKAGTGQSIKALREIAKVSAKSAGDAERAFNNVEKSGRVLLDESVIPRIANSKKVGEKTAKKLQEIGEKIGQVGEEIDKFAPQSIKSQEIADEILDYASKIPATTGGKGLQERLLQEATDIAAMGDISFKDAQKIKNQYKFKSEAADAFISNQDAVNAMNALVTKKMDEAADRLVKNPPAGMNAEAVSKYRELRAKYGPLKTISDAATDRALKDLTNRLASPSDYGIGGAFGIASAVGGNGLTEGAVTGAIALMGHKLVREYGSAAGARALDAISKVVTKSPKTLEKWGPVFTAGAATGASGTIAAHHMLMSNDEEYKKAIEESLKVKKSGFSYPGQTQGLRLP
jgi:hypothetical protein